MIFFKKNLSIQNVFLNILFLEECPIFQLQYKQIVNTKDYLMVYGNTEGKAKSSTTLT